MRHRRRAATREIAMALSESARMSTAEEYRFRINAPNSKGRAVKIVALDHPAEAIVSRLSKREWDRAQFFTAAAFSDGQAEGWLSTIAGEKTDVEKEIDTADLIVMIASIGEQEAVAARLSGLCGRRNVMTTALLLGDETRSDAALAKTLAQLRPYARMLVIASAEEYIEDMLRALRA
jgi:hypothetical protein